jgi:uncharacterized protein YkwD
MRAVRQLVLGVAAASLLAGCGVVDDVTKAVQGGGSGTTSMTAAEEAFADEVLWRTNEERASAGLPPLLWHNAAAEVAYQHCRDMDERDFFAHVNPDGWSLPERYTAAGVAFTTYGENIARGQSTPEEVVHTWINSPDHRASILNPAFTHLGVGVRIRLDGPWWTQDFLTPP